MFISSVRTLYIQLIREVDKNVIGDFPIKGKRGTIYDRNGKKMAYDVKVLDVILKKSNTPSAYEIASFFSENFELDLEGILDKINNEGAGSLKLLSNVNQNTISQFMEEIEQM